MRGLLHIFIRTVSLVVLVLVVFLMNVYTTIFKKSTKEAGSEGFFANNFSISFSANKAHADVPVIIVRDNCDEGGSK
ncbi:MAG: hypothetical protein WC814_02290 [Candidatus Paceibacterota bacterium]|jgi:hypothetical protein